jgi:hypothetical protein
MSDWLNTASVSPPRPSGSATTILWLAAGCRLWPPDHPGVWGKVLPAVVLPPAVLEDTRGDMLAMKPMPKSRQQQQQQEASIQQHGAS